MAVSLRMARQALTWLALLACIVIWEDSFALPHAQMTALYQAIRVERCPTAQGDTVIVWRQLYQELAGGARHPLGEWSLVRSHSVGSINYQDGP